jgi:hypothetical protein
MREGREWGADDIGWKRMKEMKEDERESMSGTVRSVNNGRSKGRIEENTIAESQREEGNRVGGGGGFVVDLCSGREAGRRWRAGPAARGGGGREGGRVVGKKEAGREGRKERRGGEKERRRGTEGWEKERRRGGGMEGWREREKKGWRDWEGVAEHSLSPSPSFWVRAEETSEDIYVYIYI